MTTKLKHWTVKTSDILLVAWVFFMLYFAIGKTSALIYKAMGDCTLATLLSAFFMQLVFLLYALGVNKYLGLGLFNFTLKWDKLMIKTFKYFFISLFLVFGIGIVSRLLAIVFEFEFETQDAVALWLDTNGALEKSLGIFSIVILAPLAEELLFRGVLFRILRARVPLVFAMFLSSLAFALIHYSIFAFTPLLAFSLLLVYLYNKFSDIRLCILLHLLFNLFNTILLIICQSGQHL